MFHIAFYTPTKTHCIQLISVSATKCTIRCVERVRRPEARTARLLKRKGWGGGNGGIVKVENQLCTNSGFSLGTTPRPAWEAACTIVSVCLHWSWCESVSGQGSWGNYKLNVPTRLLFKIESGKRKRDKDKAGYRLYFLIVNKSYNLIKNHNELIILLSIASLAVTLM